jgi:hypothetical protein
MMSGDVSKGVPALAGDRLAALDLDPKSPPFAADAYEQAEALIEGDDLYEDSARNFLTTLLMLEALEVGDANN